ncbi:DNA-directed RNA polymerase subunit alpha C-terminal domain-containing protein [Nonomuraea jabiensis]|uniref:DNA-directed RNA polymerase subunit alpha C-terminal domain-containing protein n=1 Tax=Nonomuraea jabiensis TaxID=882448 RepID=UPI003D765273
MNTTPIADLVTKSGLPDNHPIKALPGLTFHVTNPLRDAEPSITTVGDLTAYTDADLVGIPQFGERRLDKVKAALLAATG